MDTIESIGRVGTEAVRKLRETKLRNGIPFMINVKGMSNNECYMEYPDGIIKLVLVRPSKNDIDVIRTLTHTEIKKLRTQLHIQEP